MARIQSYRDLIVWQKGIEFCDEIYLVTSRFPRREMFGITSQLRRAAVSIPSNIAEGHAQLRRRAFVNHLDIALGSLGEVDTMLEIARRQKYLAPSQWEALMGALKENRRMMIALLDKLSPLP